MSKTVTAVKKVERVNKKGIMVEGKWFDFSENYRGIPPESIAPGREYLIHMRKEGERWLVSSLATLEEEREKKIARMNALSHATQIAVASGEVDPENVIKIAQRFFKYIEEGC